MDNQSPSAHPTPIEEAVASAIRHIVRAVDLNSRRLVEQHGLTGPQIATLRAACRLGHATAGTLARAVHLSQPTVTGILDRLERKGLVSRCRGTRDRRSVTITVTEKGRQSLDAVPSVLHQRFREELGRLPEWEQNMILATLQRVASMMTLEPAGRLRSVSSDNHAWHGEAAGPQTLPADAEANDQRGGVPCP